MTADDMMDEARRLADAVRRDKRHAFDLKYAWRLPLKCVKCGGRAPYEGGRVWPFTELPALTHMPPCGGSLVPHSYRPMPVRVGDEVIAVMRYVHDMGGHGTVEHAGAVTAVDGDRVEVIIGCGEHERHRKRKWYPRDQVRIIRLA